MSIRRVVTGHSSDGKSVIASDEGVAGFEPPGIPGHLFHVLWGADSPQTYPDDGALPDHGAWFAPVGGVRFVAWTVPPDSAAAVGDEAPEALEETERLMPGLLGLMEPDTPGFHRSDTTDLIYIVSGRIMLQLDDGVEVKAGTRSSRTARATPGETPAASRAKLSGCSSALSDITEPCKSCLSGHLYGGMGENTKIEDGGLKIELLRHALRSSIIYPRSSSHLPYPHTPILPHRMTSSRQRSTLRT